jgi:DNA-directed RNA polymerase subunit RPC12/RpoP
MAETPEATARNAAASGRQTCPKCQSERVFRSHRRNRIEILESWLGWFPHRCRDCGHRYLVRAKDRSGAGVKDWRPDLDKRRRRRLLHQILIAAICVVVFLVFLHYLVQPGTFISDA